MPSPSGGTNGSNIEPASEHNDTCIHNTTYTLHKLNLLNESNGSKRQNQQIYCRF